MMLWGIPSSVFQVSMRYWTSAARTSSIDAKSHIASTQRAGFNNIVTIEGDGYLATYRRKLVRWRLVDYPRLKGLVLMYLVWSGLSGGNVGCRADVSCSGAKTCPPDSGHYQGWKPLHITACLWTDPGAELDTSLRAPSDQPSLTPGLPFWRPVWPVLPSFSHPASTPRPGAPLR